MVFLLLIYDLLDNFYPFHPCSYLILFHFPFSKIFLLLHVLSWPNSSASSIVCPWFPSLWFFFSPKVYQASRYLKLVSQINLRIPIIENKVSLFKKKGFQLFITPATRAMQENFILHSASLSLRNLGPSTVQTLISFC